jgi:hypothetical protein
VPVLKGHPVDTSTIPERWITSNAMVRKLHGPAELIAQAWIDAGKPGQFETFRKHIEVFAALLDKNTAGPSELVAELEVHGRLLYLAVQQMTVSQKALYARNAHAAGIDVGTDYSRGDACHAVIKRFGGARA